MPRELVAVGVRQLAYREYADRALQPGEVRLSAEFGAAKHGTELTNVRGQGPSATGTWDGDLRLFRPSPDGAAGVDFPVAVGNMLVGTVEEVHPSVKRWRPGDRAFCHSHFRETVTLREGALRPLAAEAPWQLAVCLDPAEFALAAVRDGQVRLGDHVAVFGLGAIGLLIVAFARLQGAAEVYAIDPLEDRRTLSTRLGASRTFPGAGHGLDAAVEVRRLSAGRGADVTFEASGSYRALHEAIRTVAFGGTVVSASAYSTECTGGLMLGAEFHLNRPTLVSARACSDPNREHPRWTDARVIDAALALLLRQDFPYAEIVQPIVAFTDAAEAYMDVVDRHPERSVKFGVRF